VSSGSEVKEVGVVVSSSKKVFINEKGARQEVARVEPVGEEK
jgi:hypothetical protein